MIEVQKIIKFLKNLNIYQQISKSCKMRARLINWKTHKKKELSFISILFLGLKAK
jgi:glycosyltransferase involved in cell wall biosynthesis